jgi:hypothetical protein
MLPMEVSRPSAPSGRLRVSDACALIGLRRRQVFRLLRGLKRDGATSLLSQHRGKPSNHRLPAAARAPGLLAESMPSVDGCPRTVRPPSGGGWLRSESVASLTQR